MTGKCIHWTQLKNSLVWCSVREFPSFSLGDWWPCCMLACVGCWNCRGLDPVGPGKSADCNKPWSEGLKLCSFRGYVVPCCWAACWPFVLVNLGTDRRDLRVTEESDCDTTPVSGGGGEAGMFCAGEDMPVSQFAVSLAAGWRLLFTERLERELQVQFNLWASHGSCL
jgi:hypothetical protein